MINWKYLLQTVRETIDDGAMKLALVRLIQDKIAEQECSESDSESSTSKLLPCPVCGSEYVDLIAESNIWYQAICHNCKMAGPMNDFTGREWNSLPRKARTWVELHEEERQSIARAVCKDSIGACLVYNQLLEIAHRRNI